MQALDQHIATLAVLLGDALFAQAMWLSTQFPTTEVCSSVSVATLPAA